MEQTMCTPIIDFEKAFDTVNWDTGWKLQWHHEMPQKIIKLVSVAYEPLAS